MQCLNIFLNQKAGKIVEFMISHKIGYRKTYPVQPSEGYIQLRIFNGIPECSYTLGSNLTGYERISINGLGLGYEKFIYIENKTLPLKYTVQEQTGCPKLPGGTFIFKEKLAYSIFLQNKILPQSAHVYLEAMEKSNKANPLVRNLANINPDSTIVWKSHKTGDVESTKKANNREIIELRATTYDVLIDDVKVHEVTLRHGGVYSLVMGIDEHDTTVTQLAEVIKANSMSILWLIPQYVVMTLGEVMFSVTGLEFSYSQSPVTMKSVLQACWLLTVAFGNVIVVIVAEAKIFKSQANEFFLFAGLMFADMIVFMWVAYRYKPNDPNDPSHRVQKIQNFEPQGNILKIKGVNQAEARFSPTYQPNPNRGVPRYTKRPQVD